MHDGAEREMIGGIDVGMLDPSARGGDEARGADRLATLLRVRAIPRRQPRGDGVALLRHQGRGG